MNILSVDILEKRTGVRINLDILTRREDRGESTCHYQELRIFTVAKARNLFPKISANVKIYVFIFQLVITRQRNIFDEIFLFIFSSILLV